MAKRTLVIKVDGVEVGTRGTERDYHFAVVAHVTKQQATNNFNHYNAQAGASYKKDANIWKKAMETSYVVLAMSSRRDLAEKALEAEIGRWSNLSITDEVTVK